MRNDFGEEFPYGSISAHELALFITCVSRSPSLNMGRGRRRRDKFMNEDDSSTYVVSECAENNRVLSNITIGYILI